MSTVLLATFGESPVVITSMIDLLAAQAQAGRIAPIDIVKVLRPEYDTVELGYAEPEQIAQRKEQVAWKNLWPRVAPPSCTR